MIKSQNNNDCYTCAIATLLNIPYEEAPYMAGEKEEDFFAYRDKWLEERGYISISFPWNTKEPFPIFSGKSIRCIADLQAEHDTHAVVIEAKKSDDDMIEVSIIYDNHGDDASLGTEDIIYLDFIYKGI